MSNRNISIRTNPPKCKIANLDDIVQTTREEDSLLNLPLYKCSLEPLMSASIVLSRSENPQTPFSD